jgi:pimeloyl-ACP methyl ester carboxylesterase
MNNKRVILIHGFNVRDGGAGSILKLAPYFEAAGYRVKTFRYGFFFLLRVRLLVDRFARVLADMSEPGDIVVAHSNGCLMAQIAAELGGEFAQLVYINPALDRDTALPSHVKRLHVWHSPGDKAVSAARFMPAHRWGDMGAVGYRGPFDPRVTNYDKEFGYPVKSGSHSDIFLPGKIEFFAPLIVKALIA